MKPEVKKKWVQALRSRKFRQAKGALQAKRGDKAYGYCCLGVLCKVYAEEHPEAKFVPNGEGGGRRFYAGVPGQFGYGTLPFEVRSWAGLSACNPLVDVPTKELPDNAGYGDITKVNMAYLNDSANFTFEQLADLIEEQL